MLYKFFLAQWKCPSKQDWTEQVRLDLTDLGLEKNLDLIQSKSQFSFKNLVKIKTKEFALDLLNESKYKHSKWKT